MKLKNSIYLMIFLCSFVPVCVWIMFSYYDTERRMETVVRNNIEAIAGSQVMSIQNFCEGRKESMETISNYEIVQSAILNTHTEGHSKELDLFLADNKENKSFVASLSVVDADFCVVGSSENYEAYGVSEFKYSNEKYHTGQFVLGDIYDRETDDGLKRIIPAYIGIYRDGSLIGYLVEEIECMYFDRLRLQTDFLEDGTLYLVDGKSNLITAGTSEETVSRKEKVTSEEERESYQAAWDAFDHENYSEGIIYYEFQGQKFMTYFSDIEYTDWGIRITENMSAQMRSNQSIYLLLVFEGLVMVVALFFIQMFIARKLVGPVSSIVRTLKEVQRKHDYSLRTKIRRKDEVGTIASGIDELLDFIEEEELEEKRKQREFAEEARRRAEASNLAKSTFLFNASHDIRTPMNAIQGFLYIMEQNPEDSEVVRDCIQKMRKSSDILTGLLNNVLELSKIESGKDIQELKTVNLNEFVDKINLLFAKEIEDGGVSFNVEKKIDNYVVLADELKCSRILMNMLSNAKKFTPSGGKIVLGIRQLTKEEEGAASYKFYVKDNGIGMSKEFQKRAFEQFEMERTSTVSGVAGSGLGLAIIKRLVEQMDGVCSLESEPGKGTEISVTLKLQVAEKTAGENKQIPQELMDFTGKRVLMVEDNEINREIARFVLEEAGMVVEEAEDGSVAVNKLLFAQKGDYDFVLMDIQMPIMDGYTATKKIREMSNPDIAGIPIVAMTANAFKEDREKCLAIGMNEHIPKPIDVKQLFSTLQRVI